MRTVAHARAAVRRAPNGVRRRVSTAAVAVRRRLLRLWLLLRWLLLGWLLLQLLRLLLLLQLLRLLRLLRLLMQQG